MSRARTTVPIEPAQEARAERFRRWAPVLRNRKAAEATWWTEVECPEIARSSVPGQFVMIGFGGRDVGAPFIPRPFSVGWRSEEGVVGLLVRVFGEGTRRFAALRPGDELLLLGPLGSGFQDPGEGTVVCVAGGVGLAPFLFLVPEYRERGRTVRLLYGERNGARVFDPDLIRELTGQDPEVWTEDGSVGREGLVLDGVGRERNPSLMACGPTPMLEAAARLAFDRGLELQVSVEEHMGCGVGTCQGCVVRGAGGGWKKACVEGPVFRASELHWRDGGGGGGPESAAAPG